MDDAFVVEVPGEEPRIALDPLGIGERAAVLELADGRRTLGELAAGAGLEVAELEETLQGLVDLGAVRFSTGS